ncbi:DNA-binding domain-containing protein, AraC-type [Sphaerochaeta pleomorpha str. Grapes]|uniref:DNA-binding domain-containing protein, AraC-type n=1 Tax=Sphaerochaeta pleomorpha (strain ATCC BAA-1885 / DSM 22778 / Grapes) TaxID=158190 RepID=G8QRY1_SPHPG|nr:helix-turn-helix domain-containing protein [Sphaerochaeta pleomorpha]AEV29979.1 DNA-binding domain-containing protein, AraC-type [Sphaerochaeta pleomorpha str. Grapes]
MDDFQRNAVKQMLDYIESHLSFPISLYQLAQTGGYSAWHAARLFKEATGTSPFSYIRSRRLAAAAHQLGVGKQNIIDVAMDFVFDSHEGFTRAFTKQFGMNPSDFRKALATYHARTAQLTISEGEKCMETVFVQVIDRMERKAVVKFAHKASDYFEYCEEVGCEIWDTLGSIKGALFEPIGMWMPKNMRKLGTGEYVQGVEVPVDYKGEIPEGFDSITLPACKMMVFQGPAYEDEHFEQAITNLWELMKTYDPKLYGFEWADEDGPRFQLAPMGYRGYIEARPVRALNQN